MTHQDPLPAEPKADKSRRQSFLTTPSGFAICVFLAVAGVFLLSEHRIHLLGAWPLLFLLFCGGMHFFMHQGHGERGEHKGAVLNGDVSAYGLWVLAAVNAGIFILFAFSFFKPTTARDWRSLGAFSAFIIALFAEMYGFPLSLYLLAGWVGSNFPGLDPLSHDAGHLWPTLFGWSMNLHGSPFHLLSFVFIGGGLMLIAAAWRVLHDAQSKESLATTGPYASLRHPQYAGFALIMIGFFLQWPTLVTGLMLPVLLVIYSRLAKIEECEVEKAFGDRYRRYASLVPAFLPRPAGLLSSRGG